MISVTIIMPVFNCEDYLEEQINSLLEQSLIDFELIIVNDGSTDLSRVIIAEYQKKDERIRIFNNEFSKGIAGSLNTALKYAKGKYIARADGDDIHCPNRLKIQFDFLESNQKIDIIGTRSLLFNENGFIRTAIYPQSSIELCWNCISNTYFCHPSVMFRSFLYKELGGYPSVLVEDFAYFSKILKSHRGYNLPISLLYYRVHDKSYSQTNANCITDYVKMQFRENYKYYVNDLALIDEFYLFQVHKILSPKLFLRIISINSSILNRIRTDYKMNYFDSEFLLELFRHFIKIVKATCHHIKINMSFYLKSRFNVLFRIMK